MIQVIIHKTEMHLTKQISDTIAGILDSYSAFLNANETSEKQRQARKELQARLLSFNGEFDDIVRGPEVAAAAAPTLSAPVAVVGSADAGNPGGNGLFVGDIVMEGLD
jgi:hypothetical protein